jgi:dolichyl-phosphate-mannose--protein O-mannosyl transferase
VSLKWLGALAVAIVGWFCFVQHRADPPMLFWDENYHVTSAERYVEGYAQLTPHPPLGLLLIAAGERLSGANRGLDKHILTTRKSITGEDLPKGFDFSGMRLMPALFAVLGALAFYGLMLEISGSAARAAVLSGLYLFENAFVVHFRAVHLEGIQMAFMVAALWQFVRCWKMRAPPGAGAYALLGALVALAVMVKVNAAFLAALPLLLGLRDLRLAPARVAVGGSATALAAATVVLGVCWIHALVGHRPPDATTPGGEQDLRGMSAPYRAYASGERALGPAVLWAITRDSLRNLGTEHLNAPRRRPNDLSENGSQPWRWPFHDRNINYRWDSSNGSTAYVELAGNQLAWYSGTLAVLASLVLLVRHQVLRIVPAGRNSTWQLIECLVFVYLLFMAMSLWFESRRVMYLYHYFPGLLLSYVLLALWWQRARELSRRFARHATSVLASVIGLFLLCYLFFLPLSNHVPLTRAECEQRNIGFLHILDCR